MATKYFTSAVQMKQILEPLIVKAVEKACNRLLGTLQQLIMSEYYDQYSPDRYKREFMFYDSAITRMLNSLTGEILMDESIMNYDEYWNGELQLEFSSRGYHGGTDIQTEGRFWQSFIEYCEANAKNILREELKNVGIDTL